jgi:hypothetical protein
MNPSVHASHRGGLSRRSFLADTGMGVTGMALSAMLFKDGTAHASARDERGVAHLSPKAKSVIWIFLIGGVSQMESFDPKPMLTKYAGKSIDDTPFADAVNPERINKILLQPGKDKREVFKQIFPLCVPYQKRGQCGVEMSDWFPNIGGVADDIAFVRSMWTIDNNHGAQLTFHTGRKITDPSEPALGAWVSYGLGSGNANLPEFMVLGEPSADCCGRSYTFGPAYLGPHHAGVRLNVDPVNPLSYMQLPKGVTMDEQLANLSLLGKLNALSGVEYPEDMNLRARIQSYELAFQMQTAVPELMSLDREPEHVRQLYGLDVNECKIFGSQLLAARRMVERGVRFVQIFHGYNGGAGRWDNHANLAKSMPMLAMEVDQPVAGLIRDLKQRGMLEDTLVVWGTEFGRTPGAEFRNSSQGTGRDHHPHGFTCWLAGGGVKGGTIHGATDELGFHAVEKRHYVTDLHATVLHQLGLDPRRLEVPGRKRLEKDFGEPITAILA